MAVTRKALVSGAFLFFLFICANPSWAREETAVVRHVLDGDSFVLTDGRQGRLIGINAPEFGKDGAPHQPLAREARDRLSALIAGRAVTLSFEAERTDRYGRLLVYLPAGDGTGVQELLLREGLAWMVAIPPNLEKLAIHRAAEDTARTARRGIWREPAYTPRPAASLTRRDTGFHRIEGKILRVGQGRKTIYFDLATNVAIAIPRDAWVKYFHGQPSEWIGRRVVARGWISLYQERLRLRVAHPAMLTWSE